MTSGPGREDRHRDQVDSRQSRIAAASTAELTLRCDEGRVLVEVSTTVAEIRSPDSALTTTVPGVGSLGQIFRTAGMGPRATAAFAGLGVCFAVLTGLVAAGKLTSVDQYAVDHLMPALAPGQREGNGYRGLFLPFSSNTNWWSKLLDTWVYPCSVLISGILLLGVLVVLWRRGRAVAGLTWVGAWVVGNGIEVVGKGLVSRPALYGSTDHVRIHVTAFDQAFPSGHSIRCVIVAGAIVFVWRRLAPPVFVWALLVAPALVFTAAHTPSDVVGGGLIGVMLLLLGWPIAESSKLEGLLPWSTTARN